MGRAHVGGPSGCWYNLLPCGFRTGVLRSHWLFAVGYTQQGEAALRCWPCGLLLRPFYNVATDFLKTSKGVVAAVLPQALYVHICMYVVCMCINIYK